MAILKLTRRESTGPGKVTNSDVSSGWDGDNQVSRANARSALIRAAIEDFERLARYDEPTRHVSSITVEGEVAYVVTNCRRAHADGKVCRGREIMYAVVAR